jgi:tetratricopeptide (TPR) repeat protein
MLQSLLSQLLSKRRKGPQVRAPAPDGLAHARLLFSNGQWGDAARVANDVLTGDPNDVEAILLLARIFRAQNMLHEAQDAYRRALALEPRRAEAWLDLGVCHHLAGDHFWARVHYRFAQALEADNAQVWNEFGVVDIALGNYGKAEQALEAAIARNPALPEAWNNLGLIVARRGDLGSARRHFLRAGFLRPDFYLAHCNAGLAARDLELVEDAERALRRAIEIDPGPHTAWLNLGSVLQDAGRLDEALAALEAARQRAPSDPDVLVALSTVHLRRGEASEAEALARSAIGRAPQHADAMLALAYAQLATGNFAEGWINYEARHRSAASPARRFPFPAWRNEPLAGKSVLVWGEQGLGDEIMFASCLPDLLATGAHCTLDCSPRLRALFERSFPDIRFMEDKPSIDVAISLASLPLLFRRERKAFPRHAGYLSADPARSAAWRQRLDALGTGRKVGLAWRGGLMRTGRVQRSIALDSLHPLLRIPGITWVNLQHGDTAAEIASVRDRQGTCIKSFDGVLEDLDETAALVEGLDLVITVCSTVVHLAGALGRPAWVLTPRAPAWRYLLEGTQMPWYPSVAMYRQDAPGDWSPVVQRVAADLQCSAD